MFQSKTTKLTPTRRAPVNSDFDNKHYFRVFTLPTHMFSGALNQKLFSLSASHQFKTRMEKTY